MLLVPQFWITASRKRLSSQTNGIDSRSPLTPIIFGAVNYLVLTDEQFTLIERLRPAAITLDESHLTILLNGIVTDAATIRQAVEIAAAVVAVPTRGPFR